MGILMEDFKLGRNKTALPPGLTELTWDSRISDLLPADEWGLANEWATKEANIGDILSHVSGLPRSVRRPHSYHREVANLFSRHDFAWDYNDSTLDVVKRLRHLKTTHGLRQEWDYNNQVRIENITISCHTDYAPPADVHPRGTYHNALRRRSIYPVRD